MVRMKLKNYEFSLNRVADPTAFHEPLNLGDIEPERLQGFLKSMMRIRLAERTLRLDGVTAKSVDRSIWGAARSCGRLVDVNYRRNFYGK